MAGSDIGGEQVLVTTSFINLQFVYKHVKEKCQIFFFNFSPAQIFSENAKKITDKLRSDGVLLYMLSSVLYVLLSGRLLFVKTNTSFHVAAKEKSGCVKGANRCEVQYTSEVQNYLRLRSFNFVRARAFPEHVVRGPC